MKQPFQLNIENPCHEQWESFRPTATGGFCALCQKNVIDFSTMSESALVAFFRDRISSSQNLCGRFRDDQLMKTYDIEEWFPTWRIENNALQYEIPIAILKKQDKEQKIMLPMIRNMKVVRNMAAAVLTLLCLEQGIGQNRVVSGQVVDAEGGEALPGVSISIKGTKRGTMTDSIGNYRIFVSANDTLIFSFIGFEEFKQKASEIKVDEQIVFSAEAIQLGEVVATGIIPEQKDFKLGGIGIKGICLTNTPLKKFASKIALRGNAVQNGELLLVPELVASKDSTGNSFERTNDEKWFRENGFQQITSVQLYDYSGRIFQEKFTKLNDGMISVDVRGIPQGTYIVRAVYKNERSLTENENSTARVLIER